jgi:hypothetical protein
MLDIILNRTGDVFAYDADHYPVLGGFDPRWDRGLHRVKGFHAKDGTPSLPFGAVNLDAHPGASPGGAIRPAELQDMAVPEGPGSRLLRPQERHFRPRGRR